MKPSDFGKIILVEECQKISISPFIKRAKDRLKEVLLASEIETSKMRLELTTSMVGFGGKRYWFKCPMCQRRVGVVFIHPIDAEVGCRTCLRLKYRKCRYKGMMGDAL